MMADEPGFNETDETIRERCLSTLEKMHPHFSREDVLAFRTSRSRCVMALPTLGYSDRLPPMVTSIPGVLAINSAHILKGNLNVNETIQIAEEAMQTVLKPLLDSPSMLPTAASSESELPPSTLLSTDVEADRELVARS
jgi:hypothetical protein